MKTVFTNGCFDILHRGHFELLQYCKALGHVVVGLNSDASIKKIKGLCRPIHAQNDRKFMLESCKFVDKVVIFDESTPYGLIKQIKPDIIVKGGDYRKEDVVGHDIAEVKIFDYVDGFSTTSILKRRKNDICF